MKDYIIKKKDFTATGRRIISFAEKYKTVIFSVTGLSAACAASIFFWCGSLIFWLSICAAVIVFFCLKFADVEIESPYVRSGWAGITHAVFLIMTSICPVTDSFLHTGVFAAVISCIILYTLIPKISYGLKLNDVKEGVSLLDLKDTQYNGFVGMLFLYMIITIIITISETNAKENFDFSQEQYVKVTQWNIENHQGNTYYIISCPKGRFAVSPYKYPEIRDINKNTQVKVLLGPGYEGLLEVKKLEIKNR